MAKYVDTYIICWQCRGTGHRPAGSTGSDVCPYCLGTGKLHQGHLDIAELDDKLNDILNKLDDILEKL